MGPRLRNVFDQYEQPENRLTHALATALHEDQRLLKSFVFWTTGRRSRGVGGLKIVEQRLPNELEREKGGEKHEKANSLPDAWIYDDKENWCLLIESKLASSLDNCQLRRHRNTAKRRDFICIDVLALVVAKPENTLPPDVHCKTWSEVYKWLLDEKTESDWARRTAEYMEVAEWRFSHTGHLREGTLTTFEGFVAFGKNEPYDYHVASRLLRLAMDELRKSKDLVNKLGMDPQKSGRQAITGSRSDGIWDYLQLKDALEAPKRYPHLDLSLDSKRLVAVITLSNVIKSLLLKRIVDLGPNGFADLCREVSVNLAEVSCRHSGAVPFMEAVQKRFPSQNAVPFEDARLEFDLRTAFGDENARPKVKQQPQWLDAVYEALKCKRSNLQVSVGMVFPYGRCQSIAERSILDGIAGSWMACRPVLHVMGLVGEP